MSIGLLLFQQLCEVANGLEYVRDQAVPATQTWLDLTDLLGTLDAAIDALVHSQGLGECDDA